jgi:hypothetical protein
VDHGSAVRELDTEGWGITTHTPAPRPVAEFVRLEDVGPLDLDSPSISVGQVLEGSLDHRRSLSRLFQPFSLCVAEHDDSGFGRNPGV